MDLLGIFAKYWEPGKVKTRLAADIGHQQASQIYGGCLRLELERFGRIADRRLLVFSPLDRRDAFQAIAGSEWEVQPQADGNLGARMQDFFHSALDAGGQRVVLLGSDSPTLPVEFVEQAFARLRQADVVLGPSRDGGYYLVGAAQRVPPIFDDIQWSSPLVWQQTLDRINSAGTPLATLPGWYDVDHIEDLDRLEEELNSVAPNSTAVEDLLAVVRQARRTT